MNLLFIKKQYINLDHTEPIINEDLTNCWKCPNCVHKGYITNLDQQQHVAQSVAPQKSSDQSQNMNILNDCSSSSNSSILTSINSVINLSSSDSPSVTASSRSESPSNTEDSSVSSSNLNQKKKNKSVINETKQNGKSKFEKITVHVVKEDLKPMKEEMVNEEDPIDTITVDSLTFLEKQVILREFCEAYFDQHQNVDDFVNKPTQKKRQRLSKKINIKPVISN